ncbi:MAG: hypothetical protein D4Q79_01165 [Spirochaetia bacterium]|nr:MAG: hypothetical protein D4Q79_01165 [Spirochaetia bacterium]
MQKTMENEEIIKQIENLLGELRQSLNMPKMILSQNIKNKKSEFSGLRGNIYELIEDGFFDEPKTISELQKKLKDRGIKRPTTTLMPSLTFLVVKRILDRDKPEKGLYKYFKR